MNASDGTVDIVINQDQVVVIPRGWWKAFSLRRRLLVPLASVVSAHVANDPTTEIRVRFRVGGTSTLSIRAGYMRGDGTRSWWCYRYGQPAVVIALALPKLTNLVIMTDNNEATVAALNAKAR